MQLHVNKILLMSIFNNVSKFDYCLTRQEIDLLIFKTSTFNDMSKFDYYLTRQEILVFFFFCNDSLKSSHVGVKSLFGRVLYWKEFLANGPIGFGSTRRWV
jgi:hypothetical protein